ncbi:MAG: DUF5596 domain-containing protein [Clostridia bacterium]|nr:DUF5596 domain-containing protein [Clostridia bacterium]
MKNYLQTFFKRFEYEPYDAQFLCDVYDCIMANEPAAAAFSEALALYRESDACDHERVLVLADQAALAADVHEYTAELLVYICMSEELEKRYIQRGLPVEIFENSMLDLRYKLEECKAVKGVVGSFVAFWFAGFFDLTRFALGRLQFELIPFGEHYEKDGHVLTPDSRVINVHIPRTGTRLDEVACEEAYRRAASFFAEELGDEIAFVCNSWLLYPAITEILPETSNIVRFMKRYDVFMSGVNKHKPDLWRLFDTEEQHPDRLPADTTARRLFIKHIKEGGKLGWGYGVFFL